MTQIKSAKAKEYIDNNFISECNDVERYLVHYGEDGVVLEKGRIGRCRRYADKAVILAETEAEERHAKQLQELKDRAVETFREFVQYYTAKAGYKEISQDVDYYIAVFTQKLNE